MASGGGHSGALLARLLLLALNLALLALGITLLVLGTRHSHYSGLLTSIYANGGLTVAVFEEPDAALVALGAILTFVSLKGNLGACTGSKKVLLVYHVFCLCLFTVRR